MSRDNNATELGKRRVKFRLRREEIRERDSYVMREETRSRSKALNFSKIIGSLQLNLELGMKSCRIGEFKKMKVTVIL